jgi:hypothetical protein
VPDILYLYSLNQKLICGAHAIAFSKLANKT